MREGQGKREDWIWGKGEVGGGTGRSDGRGNCDRDVIDEKRNINFKKKKKDTEVRLFTADDFSWG